MLRSADDAAAFVQEVGFLPLLPCGIEGWSVFDQTDPAVWEIRGEGNPWEWRYALAARSDLAYGKFFRGKIGFVSRAWLPAFLNLRRCGYDFDARSEEGLTSFPHRQIMALFAEGAALPSWEIQRVGAPKLTEKHLTELQMQGYLLIGGFEKKRGRSGAGYGWPCSVYTTPETRFGAAYVASGYAEEPETSLVRMTRQLCRVRPQAKPALIEKLLRG